MSRTRVKICGITNLDDARAAVAAGADALGFVFAKSKRRVSAALVRAILPRISPFAQAVGVFVNEAAVRIAMRAADLRLGAVQLHGDETIQYVAKLRRMLPRTIALIQRIRIRPDDSARTLAARMHRAAAEYPLLDPGAGDGATFDWQIAAGLRRRHPQLMLSGGLTPENVGEAIRIVRPFVVDVSSGVEESPGRKSAERMHAFVAAVRAADAAIE